MILDTSGLLAALDPDERMHDDCARAISDTNERLHLSPFVLCELDHLIGQRRGVDAQLAVLREVERGAFELAETGPSSIGEAGAIIERYRDLRVGLTDASLVVLANQYADATILTLDQRHFRAMNTDKGHPFRLLPADG